MLQKTFPCSNYKHASRLPHMLKINLHTKLDDGKDPKSEIDDKTKDELKEKIKNELEKDLKFEIGDKTKDELKGKIKNELEKDLKNELKKDLKNELEKDLKFELDDKTKDELKGKIKNELEKDLKCEIGDKTKNELKEKIKNELEKDLKFEIDDKTKDEIKNKIKKEIEDEIDCKHDKNGHDKGDKGKEGYDKDGFNKDGFNEKGYDKDGFNKDGFNKDGFNKDGFNKDGFNEKGYDKDGFNKDGFNEKGYDKDGYDKNGYDKGGYDRDGYNEDGYNRNGYDKDGYNEDGYDKNGFDKDGKKKGDDDDGNEVEEKAFIVSQEITQDHADATKCGSAAGYYKNYSHVGRHGFSTSELLEAFYPEMYSNPKIAEHLKMGSKVFYGAVNYKFAFSEPFDYSWGNASNMWCKKCSDSPSEIACQGDEIKSFCYPAGHYANQGYNESFFAERTCPNLVKVSGAATIKAKQVAPLILVDSSGKMIDKEGNNTQITYASLQPHLKANGHIKDCAGNANCKSFAEIMKKVAWDNDEEVLLKTVFDDTQRASPYYEDNSVSDDTNFI